MSAALLALVGLLVGMGATCLAVSIKAEIESSTSQLQALARRLAERLESHDIPLDYTLD